MHYYRKREEAYDRSRLSSLIQAMMNGEDKAHAKQVEADAFARLTAFNTRPESDKLAAANLISMAREMDLFSTKNIGETIQKLLQNAPRDTKEFMKAAENNASTNTITGRDQANPKSSSVGPPPTTSAATSSSKTPTFAASVPELTITATSTRSADNSKLKGLPPIKPTIVSTGRLFNCIAIVMEPYRVSEDKKKNLSDRDDLLDRYYHGEGYDLRESWEIDLDSFGDRDGQILSIILECFPGINQSYITDEVREVVKLLKSWQQSEEEVLGLEQKRPAKNASVAALPPNKDSSDRRAEHASKSERQATRAYLSQTKSDPKVSTDDGVVATDFSERQSLRLLMELCKRRLGE